MYQILNIDCFNIHSLFCKLDIIDPNMTCIYIYRQKRKEMEEVRLKYNTVFNIQPGIALVCIDCKILYHNFSCHVNGSI